MQHTHTTPNGINVKVCGMTQMAQIQELAEIGVQFMGMIYYPKSPRYVYNFLKPENIKAINNINKVGVFVNASAEEVIKTVDECRLHMVQLHGDETPKFCEKIADYISVVKVFRISEGDNIRWRIKDYIDVCDMFLFDTDGANFGGTGKKFSWDILADIDIPKPYFLSGGIEPSDVGNINQFLQTPSAKNLFSLDINSKFETAPGIKDMALVKHFFNEIDTLHKPCF